MFVRTLLCPLIAALSAVLVAPSGSAFAVTAIEGVRFGKHEGFVRIVVDSATPISYKYTPGAYPFVILIEDAQGAPVDQSFAASYEPLHHLILEKMESGGSKLTVTATSELTPRFLQLDKDDRDLYRLVIDLSVNENFDHLAIGQEGLNSARVRVQFGDSLTAGR